MKLTNEVKTALLAIVAIVLLVFGYSFLKGNNLLDNNRNFFAVYNDVEGLAVSSPVTINGLQVGTVTDIDFLDGKGRILVTMNVQNDFQFSKKSKARIYGGDLIGGKSMAIIPDYQGENAKSGDTLVGDIDEGLLELVNDRLKPLQEKIENAVVSADSLITPSNSPTKRLTSTLESVSENEFKFEDNSSKLVNVRSNLPEFFCKIPSKLLAALLNEAMVSFKLAIEPLILSLVSGSKT